MQQHTDTAISRRRFLTMTGLLDQPLDVIQARYTPRPPEVTKLEKYKPTIDAARTP